MMQRRTYLHWLGNDHLDSLQGNIHFLDGRQRRGRNCRVVHPTVEQSSHWIRWQDTESFDGIASTDDNEHRQF